MKRSNYLVALLFIIATVFFFVDFGKQDTQVEYMHLTGGIFGTTYSIKYLDQNNRDLQPEIEALLAKFNASVSTYDPNSTISKVNQATQTATADDYLSNTFILGEEIAKKTHGAFDMTVAPLVNYWGFGFTHTDIRQKQYKAAQIDSILQFVGYDKIQLSNDTFTKSDARVQLDASAIAKGYGVDVVADYLGKKGCENYLVEIGGEVVTKGVNPKGKEWLIGINKPVDNVMPINNELQTRVAISGMALASSGNYRNFYIKDGKKYSHTINPITGYPVEHNLLSASVIADNCMMADAYATACMVIGVDKSLALAQSVDEIEVFLIFENSKGEMEVSYTDGFKKYLIDEQ